MKKREILFIMLCMVIIYINWKILNEEVKKRVYLSELSDKHLTLMLLLNQWLKLLQKDKKITEYFYKNNIKYIAIYGMGYLGERLYDELKESTIEIKYFIDRNNQKKYEGMETKTPDDYLPEVDVLIVTPVFYYDEIKKNLNNKVKGKIISLQDILYEI